MNVSQFQMYSKGIIAEDLVLDNNAIGEVQVFAEEHHTTVDSELKSSEDSEGKEASNVKTTSGKVMGSSAETTSSIKAKWINMGSPNRVTPPYVKKGEAVMIFTFGEADLYYWTTMFAEMDIRKKEAVLHVYSNTDEHGKTSDNSTSYWTLIDTIKKVVQLHIADNDGETAGYDLKIDAKKGIASFEDTKGNKLSLNSGSGLLGIKVKTLELNADTVTVSGGNMEFDIATDFKKKVKMNGNAQTNVCPKNVKTTVK